MPVALSTAPRGAEKREESARTGSYDPAASAWTLALGDAMRICARMLIALLSHEAVPQLDSGVTGTRFASAVSCLYVCATVLLPIGYGERYTVAENQGRLNLSRYQEHGYSQHANRATTRVLKTDKIVRFLWFLRKSVRFNFKN
jgi:hypothetical protein